MKVLILYRPNTEHEPLLREYNREFERRTGKELDMLSLETQEGADKARLYDVMMYPAVLATTDDGRLLKLWQGDSLPLMNELSYYLMDSSLAA